MPRKTPPQVIRITDTVLSRNRGCGDLFLFGLLALVILIVGGCVFRAMT